MSATVHREIVVKAAQAKAFAVFAERMSIWWPVSHSIGQAPFVTIGLLPTAGGRWFERAADGSESDWGRVLAYAPPERLTLSWQIGADWVYDPDPAHGSTIDVRFEQASAGATRVLLTHGDFDRHGAGAGAIRAAMDSEGGWSAMLRLYADLVR